MLVDVKPRGSLFPLTVTFIVAVAAVYSFTGGFPQSVRPAFYYHGWPVLFLYNNGDWIRPNVIYFSKLAVAIDAAFVISAVVGCWVACKKMTAARGRFSLRTLMLTLTAIAMVCAFGRTESRWAIPAGASRFFNELTPTVEPPTVHSRHEVSSNREIQPAVVRAPLYFGLGCSIYLGLAAIINRRYHRFVRA